MNVKRFNTDTNYSFEFWSTMDIGKRTKTLHVEHAEVPDTPAELAADNTETAELASAQKHTTSAGR